MSAHAERARASGMLAGAHVGAPVNTSGAIDRATLLDQIEGALLAAKVCAYAQGMGLLRAADAVALAALRCPAAVPGMLPRGSSILT